MTEPEYHTLIRDGIWNCNPDYRILYKYQSFRPYTCASLKQNLVKYSRHAELNDAFDLAVQFPEPFGPTVGKIDELMELLQPHAGHGYDFSASSDHITYQLANREFGPLEPLAALAAQFQLEDLIADLKSIKPTYEWCGRVLGSAMLLSREMAQNTSVYCLSNDPQSHLMWGYYGDGLRGLCIGYGCAIHTNPVMLEPVRYKSRINIFDPVQAALNPFQVAIDMLYTKPSAWRHEAEWRARMISFNADHRGIMESFFPIMCAILGYRMPASQREKVLASIDRDRVAVWEARPDTSKRRYRIGWRTLDGDAALANHKLTRYFNIGRDR